MIRVRGIPISEDEARELVSELEQEAAPDLLRRLTQAIDEGEGLLATDRLEARAALFAVQRVLARCDHSPRLLELRASLAQMTFVG